MAWNQLVPTTASRATVNGVTITNNGDGSWTFNGTATADGNYLFGSLPVTKGHKYYVTGAKTPLRLGFAGLHIDDVGGGIWSDSLDYSSLSFRADFGGGAVFNGVTIYPQAYDLSLMFGSTIADYVYGLGSANGIAKLKSWGFFTEDYYPYDSGSLKSVEGLEVHVMRDADENIIGNYPLDSDLTLRGIPKLDSANQLYYDGDIYKADGSVTRKYGTRAYQSGDESLTDAITDGTNTVYKLSTTITETADPYQNPQLVDKYGTEEYVTDSVVPVGHDTDYYLDADSVLTPPSTAGTYTFKVTVASDGSKSYSWVSD